MAADDSENLSLLLNRLQAGDPTAREELITAAIGRLELLARKMLRQYPSVHRWEQTNDVLQNTLMRLDRALKDVVPDSSAGFLKLASEQIRRELIDLARHHRGVRPGEPESQDGIDPSDGLFDDEELDR
jgi:DNA-directed RNA polymerase specialized sigma24 family protein